MNSFLDWLSDPLAAIRAGYAPNQLTQSAKDKAKQNSQFNQTNNEVHDNVNNFLNGAIGWLGAQPNPMAINVAKFATGLVPPPQRHAATQDDSGISQDFMAKYGRQPDPVDEGPSETDKILERLGQRFTFDRNGVDTSGLDSMLGEQRGVLNGLRDQANSNFQTSDGNIRSMHDAFRNDQLAQAGRIQQEGDTARNNVAGIFDKTIQNNKDSLAEHNSVKEEMLKRLGIAPAANAEDGFATEVQRGQNIAQSGRDARTSEIAGNTQTNLNRNTAMATAIGNDGAQRRSDLNMRLQEILGGINQKDAQLQTDFQKSKMDLQNQGEDRAYQRWLQDRQFDQGLFNSINSANAKMAEAQAKSNSQGVSGAAGIIQDATPQFKKAFYEVAGKVNIFQNPEQAMKMLQDPKYGLNPDEVFRKVSDYAKLGTSNKFPVASAE